MYGALVSGSVLWRLRSCRCIIIIIIIIIIKALFAHVSNVVFSGLHLAMCTADMFWLTL